MIKIIHSKNPNSRGKYGKFKSKVKNPEGIVKRVSITKRFNQGITGVIQYLLNHNLMVKHSRRSDIVSIHTKYAFIDNLAEFNEYACQHGALSLQFILHLMGLAFAHAWRLKKFYSLVI